MRKTGNGSAIPFKAILPIDSAIPYFLITALLREFVGGSHEATIAEVAAHLPSVIASLGLDPQFDTTPLLALLDREADEVAFDKIDPFNVVTDWCSRCAQSCFVMRICIHSSW